MLASCFFGLIGPSPHAAAVEAVEGGDAGGDFGFEFGDLFGEGGGFVAGGFVEELGALAGGALEGFGALGELGGRERPRLLQRVAAGALRGVHAEVAQEPLRQRGHNDGVGLDEWVNYEYAKVRRLYNKLGIGDRTTIEHPGGPHTTHGVGTFEFLKKWLK